LPKSEGDIWMTGRGCNLEQKRHMKHKSVKLFLADTLWNRDTNGSLNILKLAIQGLERPKALSRKKDYESLGNSTLT